MQNRATGPNRGTEPNRAANPDGATETNRATETDGATETDRERLIAVLGDAMVRPGMGRVGIDGVDGAGKTTFADELAAHLRSRGTDVTRVGVDDFLHPPQVRYRRGRTSPEGFFRDSFDHDALRRRLATTTGLTIVDGLFLHRPELLDLWDLTVFLRVPFDVSVPRMAARDGTDPDPAAAGNRRYVQGQRIYFRECSPEARATFVVDNSDPAQARIVTA